MNNQDYNGQNSRGQSPHKKTGGEKYKYDDPEIIGNTEEQSDDYENSKQNSREVFKEPDNRKQSRPQKDKFSAGRDL